MTEQQDIPESPPTGTVWEYNGETLFVDEDDNPVTESSVKQVTSHYSDFYKELAHASYTVVPASAAVKGEGKKKGKKAKQKRVVLSKIIGTKG